MSCFQTFPLKRIFLAVIALLGIGAAFAQQPRIAPAVSNPAANVVGASEKSLPIGMKLVPTTPTGPFESKKDVPASITWTQNTVEIPIDDVVTSTAFEFTGTNNTKQLIKIPYVRLTCGCQHVGISTTTLNPNETVKLAGTISFSPASGNLVKPLEVYTDIGGPSMLTVKIIAPEKTKLSATRLSWKSGDITAQELVIESLVPDNVENVKILGNGFAHSITTTGNVTKVRVTPSGTAQRGAIRIKEKSNPRQIYVILDYGGVTSSSSPAALSATPIRPDTEDPVTRVATHPSTSNTLPVEKSEQEMKQDISDARMLLFEALKKLETTK
jgi:hypothetical protein